MSAEINRREEPVVRESIQASSNYLGAMLAEEQRLVLVPLDPSEPWAAFKRLRSWMKESKVTKDSKVDVFEAPASLEHTAKVIPLERRTS